MTAFGGTKPGQDCTERHQTDQTARGHRTHNPEVAGSNPARATSRLVQTCPGRGAPPQRGPLSGAPVPLLASDAIARVETRTAKQSVGALPVDKLVVVRIAPELVVVLIALQLVVALTAPQLVVALTAVE